MQQPLHGVRILDLSRMLTGGFAAMLLGDLGAEVIKIENPEGGDPLRGMPPHFVRGESAYFLAISRNKKSVTLDLRTERGKELFYRLVPRADVVFDNFRPGVLEKLGADFETLRGIHPPVIQCSISSFGHTGPLQHAPGFDLVIQALSGMMSYTGEPGRPPVRMGAPMGDLAGSLYAATAISAALYARERTGQGRRIELSLLDCLASLHTYVSTYYWLGGERPAPAGSGHMSVVPYRAYETADGFLTVAVFVEKFWVLLCEAIERPVLANDERFGTTSGRLEHRAAIDELLEETFRTRPTHEWMERLDRAGVPAAPVLSIDEMILHPQIRARDMVVVAPHPRGGTVQMLGHPIKQPGVEDYPLAPSPTLGQHTDEVLRELLGLPDSEIAKLRDAGVV